MNSDMNTEWQGALFKESVALIDYKTWKAKTIHINITSKAMDQHKMKYYQ